jgi:diguanylate cyclase (GGDEF)-like protein/PAS domain S-box-containing protein
MVFSLVLAFALGFCIFNMYFLGFVKKQENAQLDQNLTSIRAYLDKQNDVLNTLAVDWGKWDDTYYFIQNENKDYITNNLNYDSIANLNVSFFVYLDSKDNVYHNLLIDKENKSIISIPNDLLGEIKAFAIKNKENANSLLAFNNHFYLIKFTTITDSVFEKPPNGTFIVGRELDGSIFSELEAINDGKMLLLKTNSLNKNIIDKLSNTNKSVNIYREKSIDSYLLLSEFSNANDITFLFSKDRHLFNDGTIQMMQGFIIYSILILIISFIVFKIISEFLSKPFRKVQNYYKTLVTQMKQGLAVHEIICDENGRAIDYEFLYVNEAFEELTGFKSENIIGKTVLEVMPNTEEYWISNYGDVAINGASVHYENYSVELGKYFEVVAYQTSPMQFATVISDVSERKQIEEKLEYSFYHDELTGLHNRKYFYDYQMKIDSIKNLPLTIVIADINGLKAINEAGNPVGDKIIKKVAEIIKNECDKDDEVIRWGGDDYIIVLPKSNRDVAEQLIAKINKTLLLYSAGEKSITLSFGIATKNNIDEPMRKVIKAAEDDLFKNKTYYKDNILGSPINMILQTLHEKNEREKKHSERVSELCACIGRAMGFSEMDINKLRVIGLVHDIGKIGIDENILNKAGRLTTEECSKVKQHSEIGYRILSANDETSELGFHILSHHERLDGSGYPNGLKGENISVFTRVLSVSDAFDAMTSKRPYSDGKSIDDAVEQLRKYSNTQFDAEIVKVFIEKVVPKFK